MIYRFNELLLDTERYQLEGRGGAIAMEPQVFDLLHYLIRNRDRVVSRAELLDNLWKGKVVTDAALSARLKAVRRAVGDTGVNQGVIKTVHGRGYQFVADVEQRTADAPQEPVSSPDTQPQPPSKPSIAVLPFTNISGDAEGEHFSSGITEDLVNALSRIPTVLVIASYSTRTYKGRAVDVRQVAQEQGVRYVLEGGVRIGGNRVRITAQLIDTVAGRNLWSDRYDRDLGDLFRVQDELVRNIVVALQVQLTSGYDAYLYSDTTDNVEAWLCVVRANDLYSLYLREHVLEARRLTERALKLDPNYSYAWNMLGWTYWGDALWEWSGPRESLLDRATEAGHRGLSLAGDRPDPFDLNLFACVHHLRSEFDHALEMGERAVALAPGSHENIMILAWLLASADRPAEALKRAKEAMRLSPTPPPWASMALGICYHLNGLMRDAVEAADRAVQKEPDSAMGMVWLIISLAETGDMGRAKHVAARLLEIEPSFYAGRWFGTAIDKPILKNADVLARAIENLSRAGVPV